MKAPHYNKTEDETLTLIREETADALESINSRKKWVDLLRSIREDCTAHNGETTREIVKIIDEYLVPAVTMDQLYQALLTIRRTATVRTIRRTATPAEPSRD